MKKRALLVLLILSILLVGGCVQQLYSIGEIKDLKAGKTVKLIGIVKTGAQIGTDYHINYCPEPFYIVDESGWIQLRIEVEREGQIRRSQITSRMENYEDYEKYLGKKVEIIGDYDFPLCEEKCICDPNIIIKNIKILE